MDIDKSLSMSHFLLFFWTKFEEMPSLDTDFYSFFDEISNILQKYIDDNNIYLGEKNIIQTFVGVLCKLENPMSDSSIDEFLEYVKGNCKNKMNKLNDVFGKKSFDFEEFKKKLRYIMKRFGYLK